MKESLCVSSQVSLEKGIDINIIFLLLFFSPVLIVFLVILAFLYAICVYVPPHILHLLRLTGLW